MFILQNGDCLQVMPLLEAGSIDAIITDLPYGTTSCKWDTIIPFEPMWKEVKRVLKSNGAFITTTSQPFTSALIMPNPSMFKCEWIWMKNNPVGLSFAKYYPMRNHENVIVFCSLTPTYNKQPTSSMITDRKLGKKNGKFPSNRKSQHTQNMCFIKTSNPENILLENVNPRSVIYFEVPPRSKGTLHPTQKPVALYEYLIKTYTNEDETVLDICMGSGTTIEAAERTGRNSIGIEKDEDIFQIAVLRLNPFMPPNKVA